MLNRLTIFVHDNLYNSKRHFAQKFAEALRRKKVDVRIIDTHQGNLTKDHLTMLYRFGPDLTLSFNDMMPLPDGSYLWDTFEVPHMAILLDPAIYSLNLTKSAYCLVGYVDRDDDALFKTSGYKTSLFFPHAIENDLFDRPFSLDKPYDVVFLGSCYDHEAIRMTWEAQLKPEICQGIDAVIDLVYSNPRISLLQALIQVWREQGIDYAGCDFQTLFSFIDRYIRGKDRVELIQSIEDIEVHVFGDVFWEDPTARKGWEHYLGGQSNIRIHKPVSFIEALEVMHKSRVCLNSSPFFKNGSHERLLYPLSLGCSVLTSENLFPREVFALGRGISYYEMNKKVFVNEVLHDLLRDEEQRVADVNLGREIIREDHTWDQRAEDLIEEFPHMVAEIYLRTMHKN